jgi:hypothetical protein
MRHEYIRSQSKCRRPLPEASSVLAPKLKIFSQNIIFERKELAAWGFSRQNLTKNRLMDKDFDQNV